MNLGLSLPVEFLSGIGTSGDTEHLRKTFGAPDDFLPQVKDMGVNAIEIKSMLTETTPESVLEAYLAIRHQGMDVKLHGYLPDYPLKGHLKRLYPPFAKLFRHLNDNFAEITMIVHAYRDEQYSVEENKQHTAETLKNLSKQFNQEVVPVMLALEINRNHGRPDASYTYQGVLDMIGEDPNIGICFDFGHTYWNTDLHDLDETPPPEFLDKVFHTHIHDIGPGGTHYPLTLGKVPVQQYVWFLQQAGYKGIFNLELGCYRFAEEMGVKEGFLDSIEILKKVVG